MAPATKHGVSRNFTPRIKEICTRQKSKNYLDSYGWVEGLHKVKKEKEIITISKFWKKGY